MIQKLLGMEFVIPLILIIVIIGLLMIFGVGIIGLLAFIYLPRMLLALGIAVIGILFLFQKIPVVSGMYSWLVAIICWVVAYIIGAGVIPIA